MFRPFGRIDALSPAMTSLPPPPSIDVAAVLAARDVVAADQVVGAVAADDRVVALAADDDVPAVADVDHVVAAAVAVLREDRRVGPRDRRGRDERRHGHVAGERGEVAEDESLPSPVVIVSPPVPPITQFVPVPVIVIVSGPPSFGLIALIPVNRPARRPADRRVVADDDVRAAGDGDRVGAGAAHETSSPVPVEIVSLPP